MKYSGHKALESFSNYIHLPDEGRIVSMHAIDNVVGNLDGWGSFESVWSVGSAENRTVTPLHNK